MATRIGLPWSSSIPISSMAMVRLSSCAIIVSVSPRSDASAAAMEETMVAKVAVVIPFPLFLIFLHVDSLIPNSRACPAAFMMNRVSFVWYRLSNLFVISNRLSRGSRPCMGSIGSKFGTNLASLRSSSLNSSMLTVASRSMDCKTVLTPHHSPRSNARSPFVLSPLLAGIGFPRTLLPCPLSR